MRSRVQRSVRSLGNDLDVITRHVTASLRTSKGGCLYYLHTKEGARQKCLILRGMARP